LVDFEQQKVIFFVKHFNDQVNECFKSLNYDLLMFLLASEKYINAGFFCNFKVEPMIAETQEKGKFTNIFKKL